MLNPQTVSDLNKAFSAEPGGFLVVDSGQPKFAVLPFETYQTLKATAPTRKDIKKVLVTGGAGYIGSHTVRILQEQGYEVVVFDNLSTGRRESVVGCKLVVADLADRAALDKVFAEEKVDAVMHFAASIAAEESVVDPGKYFQNNVANGLNLLDAMVENGVSKIVFSSSAAVYGQPETVPIHEENRCQPLNPYGETKLMFERVLKWYAEGYGIRSVALRYFNAAGAWPEEELGYSHNGDETHLIPRVLDVAAGRSPQIEIYGQDYPTPDGTCVRDYVHVLDLADAHVLALEKLASGNGTYIYNVGTGQGYSVLEVVEKAMEITGKMIPIKIEARRAGDPAKLAADNQSLADEFGWRPKRTLKDILESSWQWHQRILQSMD